MKKNTKSTKPVKKVTKLVPKAKSKVVKKVVVAMKKATGGRY